MNLDNELPEPGARRRRHEWVKLRKHVYMCRHCGTGYRNRQLTSYKWERIYYLSDGQNRVLKVTPPCVRGSRGEAASIKYADAL